MSKDSVPLLSLTVNNVKSETLKQIHYLLKRKNIPHVMIVNPDQVWPYHRYLIDVFSDEHPSIFPMYYLNHAICTTKYETIIYDNVFRERLDIAVKGNVEVIVKGQVRNGANRIQFTEGQARVDEIRKVKVWQFDKDDIVLSIEACIDPYKAKGQKR
jgi:hypothetical protein